MSAKNYALRLLSALGLGALFSVASVGALVLHLDLPAGRRLTTLVLTQQLDSIFRGSFTIGGVERISRSGLLARGVVVRDPHGRVVLSVSRLRAQADLFEMLRRLLLGGPKITLVVDHVHVARADVYLYAEPDTGVPSIASAFTPRPSGREPTSSESAREVRVALQAVEITRLFGRGAVFGLPTLEVDVGGARGWLRATSSGVDLGVSRFSTVVRGLGGADARGIVSVRIRQPGWVWVSFDGHLGEVQLGSVVRIEESRVQATVDLPRARPSEVRALLPGYPLQEDAALHVDANGTLPNLQVTAELRAGRTRLSAQGPLTVTNQVGAHLEVEGQSVDLRTALPAAPETQLDFYGALQVRSVLGNATLDLQASTRPTRIQLIELPQIDWSAHYVDGRLHGSALVHEPGAPLRVNYELQPGGALTLRGEAQVARLERAPRLSQWLGASGRADVSMVAAIENGQMVTEVRSEMRALQLKGIRLERGTLRGTVRGKLAEPTALRFNAELQGTALRAGAFSFERASATAAGPLLRPEIQLSLSDPRGPSIKAAAVVSSRDGAVRVDNLTLGVLRGDEQLAGRAARVELGKGRLVLREVDLTGLGGSLRGSAELRSDLVAVEARGEQLSLSALAGLLGQPAEWAAGTFAVSADVVLARDLERGDVQLSLRDAALGPMRGVSLDVGAHLQDRRLQVNADGAVENIGTLHAELDSTLAGSALTLEAFQDMLGQARVRVSDVSLTLLADELGLGSLVKGLRGSASVEARLSRRVPYALPSVSVLGYTNGLGVEFAPAQAPLKNLTGVDARWGLEVDGESGDSSLTLKLVDRFGQLASASLSTTLDLAAAVRSPRQFPAQLWNNALLGKLIVEDRPFDHWPADLQLPGVTGRLRAEGSLSGSLAAPLLGARLYLGELSRSVTNHERAVDMCANVAWEQSSGRLASNGEVFLWQPDGQRCSGDRVAHYGLNARLGGKPGEPHTVRGNANASLEGFPLEAVPWLGGAELTGTASGKLAVTQSEDVPLIAANLDLRRVRVQNVDVGRGKLEVRSSERSIGATLRLAHEGGQLQATALAALDTGHSVPQLDPEEPIRARVTAERVNAVVLAPFLRSVLTELSGRIDGDLNASLTPTGATDGSRPDYAGTIDGRLSLRDGTLQLASLGLRLNEVQLVARAEGTGGTTRVTFDELRARAGTRRERVSVRDGRMWLEGLRMNGAEGTVDATELPLLLEGVSQATATTRQGIAFRVNRTPEQMEATFQVPYLSVVLPQSSARNIISLEENRSIELLQPLGEPRTHGDDALPWLLTFDLGDNVKITRSDLDLPLTGTAHVRLAQDVEVGGDFELSPGGRIEVSGKTFVIGSGELHFDTGDPGDPRIRVSASWRAPDGTTVVADVSGTLKQARLRLTSDPPRTEPEIYALLLGGSSAGEGGDARAAGAGVGADQILAPLLANTPLSRVEFRAGNEQLSQERSYSTYTAAVPISDEVWFEGSFKSRNTSDEEREAFSGTVDWRFRRNWSLRTEVGTIGTGVDLLWQYRY